MGSGLRMLPASRHSREPQCRRSADPLTLASFCEQAGGAVLKTAQLLAMRRDLLAPPIADELSRLHEQVTPSPLPAITRVLERSFQRPLHEVFLEFEPVPIGCGSIAQVHAGRLRSDGRAVAVKIKRPDVDASYRADMAVISRCATIAGFFLPRMPVRQIADEICDALVRQIDFAEERRAHERIRASLAWQPGVLVPELRQEYCAGDVLVMELMGPLEPLAGASTPRARSALRDLLRALYRMIFVDGLFHCDLHPGNVWMDSAGRAVLLDMGCTGRLDALQRELFREFFLSIALNRGRYAAAILRRTALSVPRGLDELGFELDVSALIRSVTGREAGRFGVAAFAADVFALQRRHGILASGAFSLPILALLVFEGLVSRSFPDLDFQAEAVEVLAGPGVTVA